MKIYLAGKMRGLPKYNFPAFEKYAKALRQNGHEVVSPAEMDIALGFSEDSDQPSKDFLKDAIIRDVTALAGCDALALIPDWESSLGVKVEIATANFLALPIFCAETGEMIDV